MKTMRRYFAMLLTKRTKIDVGICTLAVICLLGTTVFAVSEQFSTGNAGIRMFGKTELEAGETIAAPNGQEIPGVITYTDEAGGMTNYLSIRKIAELFDATISWDSSNDCIVIGSENKGASVSVGSAENVTIGETPEFGATAGPFTEIKPDKINSNKGMTIWLNDACIQSDTGITQRLNCAAGGIVLITVTNNGETDQFFNVYRPVTVSDGEKEIFQSIKIASGKTAVRAFRVNEDAGVLTSVLEFSIDGGSESGMSDLKVSAMEYYG